MITLFTFLLAIIFAIFAVQNTESATIRFAGYVLHDIPLFLLIIGSAIFGMVIVWIMNLPGNISTAMSLFGKDRTIKKTNDELANTKSKMINLEKEISLLKGKSVVGENNKTTVYKPSFLQRLTHKSA